MTHDRRTFLKRSGAMLGIAAAAPIAPEGLEGDERRLRRLDPGVLRAVAEVVLPSELDQNAREEAVLDFEDWAEGYQPVAEMNHGYGTDVIRYGPPDPVPAWTAQLEALQLEARRRNAVDFASLDVVARRVILERQDLDTGGGLPNPVRAQHIAVALMAHWFRSADATDRCYGRRIMERLCRGIDTAPEEPRER